MYQLDHHTTCEALCYTFTGGTVMTIIRIPEMLFICPHKKYLTFGIEIAHSGGCQIAQLGRQ